MRFLRNKNLHSLLIEIFMLA